MRRHWSTDGAAYLEALIALPFFILVFSGLFLAHRVSRRGLEMSERARRCAWLYAANHCTASPAAAQECAAGDMRVRAGYDEQHRALPGVLRTAVNLIEKLPLGTLVLKLLWGEPVAVTLDAERTVRGPLLTQKVGIERRSAMLCTPTPMSFDDVVNDSVDSLWRKLWN